MKYKVGDKVKVKPLSWFKQNCIWDNACGCFVYKLEPVVFTKYMQKFCNQIVTICEIGNISPVYNITEDENKLLFADWMLEDKYEEEKENKAMYIIIDKEDMGLVTKGPDFKDGFYNTLCEAEVEAQKYAKDMNISVDKLCVLSMTDNTDVYEFKSSLSHAYELSAIKEK